MCQSINVNQKSKATYTDGKTGHAALRSVTAGTGTAPGGFLTVSRWRVAAPRANMSVRHHLIHYGGFSFSDDAA